MLLSIVVLFSDNVLGNRFSGSGLRFTQISDVFPGERTEKKHKRQKKHAKKDTSAILGLSAKDKLRIDTIYEKIVFLSNPTSQGRTPLDAFFACLDKTKDSLFHIWFYGDSQIEGDRITQDLRILLQKKFGGNGQGIVPFNDIASYRNIDVSSNGIIKYNVFTNRKIKGFGFNGIKYKIQVGDSILPESNLKSPYGLKFSRVYLFHETDDKGSVSVNIDKQPERLITLTGNRTLIHEGNYSQIKVSFPMTSTSYYGYILEGQNGLQVDNCGIRGHSGDGLFSISDNVLQKHAALLNTKLVVFQYGNNAIPYIKSESHAAQVGNEFYKLFVKYRKALPQVSILVISGGDMGRLTDNIPTSYPYAGVFAEELEKAAEKAGCAFFDLHSLMQSNGGIAGWVKQGKASLDGHLSPQGQKFFAETLFKEMMKSYDIYKLRKKNSH
ncbi:MAG: hypothetical protein RLZZ161_1104 [Bacteroidota bacterium]